MSDPNIVSPTLTIHKPGLSTVVIIEMRPDRCSVGILNQDQTVARFPWAWDEQPHDEAIRIAKDYAKGLYSPERISEIGWYEMPYPIKRK